MFGADRQLRERLRNLQAHLETENPLLTAAVRSFQRLDRVGYGMGLLRRDQSFAMLIPWWPLISILGTFSAGKSSFINHYLQTPLQETGNQAVDDKFTVICYSQDQEQRVLPGIALDADPRFPFYQMSEELEHVAPGEGKRIDAYLQLKTCHCERLRGTILIDSPGFDADAQRTATLRITDYIIDLSDLVLVFFDARHPEPGAMQDTLTHLVGNTIRRHDSSKFLYILNQIDVTAREDNPEAVVGAWQRALAQEGLTAGRFYCIYNPDAAIPIDDEALRQRFESKRDADLQQIHQRMQRVTVERSYRIIDALEKTAREIEDRYLPRLRELKRRWEKGTAWRGTLLLALVLGAFLGITLWRGDWQGLSLQAAWWDVLWSGTRNRYFTVAGLLLILFGLYHLARSWSARSVLRALRRSAEHPQVKERLAQAFRKNTRFWHSLFRPQPVGWNWLARKRLQRVYADADHFIQLLNDRYADPSGQAGVMETAAEPSPADAAVEEDQTPELRPVDDKPERHEQAG